MAKSRVKTGENPALSRNGKFNYLNQPDPQPLPSTSVLPSRKGQMENVNTFSRCFGSVFCLPVGLAKLVSVAESRLSLYPSGKEDRLNR